MGLDWYPAVHLAICTVSAGSRPLHSYDYGRQIELLAPAESASSWRAPPAKPTLWLQFIFS
jgi:hypothetical protein